MTSGGNWIQASQPKLYENNFQVPEDSMNSELIYLIVHLSQLNSPIYFITSITKKIRSKLSTINWKVGRRIVQESIDRSRL
ncbi:hypothetical protein RIR_jg11809.t1 [Rhizophagus irregularis DAOM 181602=DAOM 197198]|uniref:Uncharacterized protein n=1 Tax=Rhizophagus irregularis (strain DAOM 181602 / DAOM 197198 / MUCL 43194) TaxID=747089 RepID=U9UGD8_RHIID|nr:hypothetical protein RIR_jg11809.t1 [Rhizophagus irregularis DAOM 181602=DAOM 197198]